MIRFLSKSVLLGAVILIGPWPSTEAYAQRCLTSVQYVYVWNGRPGTPSRMCCNTRFGNNCGAQLASLNGKICGRGCVIRAHLVNH